MTATNKQKIVFGLLIAIVFQVTVLAGEYIGARYPLWTGKEIRVKVIPVDPRSLFRGNYARLRYDFSRIPAKEFNTPEKLRNEERVYVVLKQNNEGVYEFDKVTLTRPQSGIFLRGRIQNRWRWRSVPKQYTIKFGVEAWFAPKAKALKMERELRKGAVAVIMVADNGKAALKDVVLKGS